MGLGGLVSRSTGDLISSSSKERYCFRDKLPDFQGKPTASNRTEKMRVWDGAFDTEVKRLRDFVDKSLS